jgi:hypothetical protein
MSIMGAVWWLGSKTIPSKVAACIHKHSHRNDLNHQLRDILEKNPSEKARLSQLPT